ncbi:exodeoxyribonuclease VII small subunit [Streptomyces sp. NPDC095613]|uniref:exodeoxyribonuclease VII small subunit n=1 Tax=Streptomyces sp. NPDC095613 TaxID=3155540 RepID=UPI0033324CE3
MARTDEVTTGKTSGEAGRGTSGEAAGEAVGGTTLGYEQARDELIEVVRRLEAGGTSLEDSLALWERGEELAKVCRRWLEGARARLDASLAHEAEEAEADSRAAGRGTGEPGA